jgi:predicted metalloprotease
MPVRFTLVAVALLSLAACAGGVSGTPAVGAAGGTETSTKSSSSSSSSTASSSSSTTRTSTSSTNGTAQSTDDTLASGVTIDELVDDIKSAEEVVDGFWAKHWTDYYTGTYRPPTVKGLYDGTDPADTPTCDGDPLEAYNAYYCEPEDYVAWDANLLVDGADLIGDSWVYLVIAHEWGHAVQARLDASAVAVADELQADCLGAAALYGAVADGTLQFEMGDEQELISSLTTLADQMPWTMSSDHGDPFQRVQWFTLGRNGGVNACHDVLVTTDASPSSGGGPASSIPAPPTS